MGYIVELSNEGGGYLVLGMEDKLPHTVVGSNFSAGKIGKLEDAVYTELAIRVHITELFDAANKRVVVTKIPSRPKGRTLKFEGVPLMRTGDSLRNMSDDELFTILSEQEQDFSATICNTLTLEDLDAKAIEVMKSRYAEKQNNPTFSSQSDEQALIDLDLIQNNKLTYAALILLGKKEKIKALLPQCAVHLEYRSNEASIQYDKRDRFQEPYFILIEEAWKIIDARNKQKHIQVGSFISDIHSLNNEVIRESVNNAVAHRDYTKASEIVIKQSPTLFQVTSHGGFPLGVSRDNILSVNSTPRNRLLSEVLTKTGFVERSGQGVDKIFYQSLSEGKGFPTYEDSDLFQVSIKIPLVILFPVFTLFIKEIQNELGEGEKLGAQHLITLVKIRDGIALNEIDKSSLNKLEEANAIKQTSSDVMLSKKYTALVEQHEGSDLDKL
ncbi:MAG: ATP-dependent DNA helicase RecG [Cyclobacteriaceae bacterium]